MRDKNYEEGLMSRYIIDKVLGEYPPWQGYFVTDSLSNKEYLYFSVLPPAGITLSPDDCRMRDLDLLSQGDILTCNP